MVFKFGIDMFCKIYWLEGIFMSVFLLTDYWNLLLFKSLKYTFK